ncbi:site-specific recombinase XerD [Anaerospora hongkongensis]|uniref:Site-specific recombinase XerD n=1 Tax=Anaerospora hongkongensis TaxID=244830 RepID=A0A4R1Q150_9FIRM|nr:tyrosine-type recombinase/integrase [Anaerospora hongkongensis]TCL39430.1 site-specific recombinase XerD [Anaerospora hongkongensis]
MLITPPSSDEWSLKDNDVNSANYERDFRFEFSEFPDDLKVLLKHYIWNNYHKKESAVSTIHLIFLNQQFARRYMSDFNITSVKHLKATHMKKFKSYLKTYVSQKTGKKIAHNTQRAAYSSLKTLILWGQKELPHLVPLDNIFPNNAFKAPARLTIDYIPDEIVEKINDALPNEPNLYLRCGIIILQCVGMRISDLLKLRIDCFDNHIISKEPMIKFFNHKKRSWTKPKPIPEICKKAIERLIELTQPLRNEAPEKQKNLLFLHRLNKGGDFSGRVKNIPNDTYNDWLHKFAVKHNITDANGDIYDLTSHMFRRTLSTDMLSQGVDLLVVQEMLDHGFAETTVRHYADIKDSERAREFKRIGIIGNINQLNEDLIKDHNELIWFKKNKDTNARLEDGYCTKPCEKDRICEHLLKRRRCYSCARYITTLEFLDQHKKHLAELELELENNVYGEHYASHLTPIIAMLKQIVARLEGLKCQ